MAQPDQIDLFGSLNRDGRPLTVAETAGRRMCSAETVRKLTKAGSLDSFVLGGKLVRIPQSAVIEYESMGQSCLDGDG